ncbi:MAG: chemotaxis protein CheW [Proteobacteria bacterium]|nr:chemotaxis protein CheW [Pseudomonadota bacterium]
MTENKGQQFLIFSLSSKLYASNLRDVKRIVPLEKIFEVPLKRENYLGLVKFEGKAIPLFNLKSAINKGNTGYSPEDLIVVQYVRGQDVGFLVDKVDKVMTLDPNSFEDYESNIPGISKKIIEKENDIMLIYADEIA